MGHVKTYSEFLNESTTLNTLGLSQNTIKKLSGGLVKSHNISYTPFPGSKTDIKNELVKGSSIIAKRDADNLVIVNDLGGRSKPQYQVIIIKNADIELNQQYSMTQALGFITKEYNQYFIFDNYENYILEGFERIRDFKPEIDYSNFTKLDSNYLSFIAKLVIRDFEDSKETKIKKILYDIFYSPSSKEKSDNENLFSEVKSAYENWIKTPRSDNFTVDDVDLIEELKDYRKRIWYSSRKRIKPYEVFTDRQLKEIVLSKPLSISELETIKNFDNEQIEKFGEEIIQIIDRYR
jgi:superfamily II DNA helicase RecQ